MNTATRIIRRRAARRAWALVAAVAVAAAGPLAASGEPAQAAGDSADSASPLREQQRSVEEALVDVDELLEDTDAEVVTAFAELQELKAELPLARDAERRAQLEHQDMQRQLAAVLDRLRVAEDQQGLLSRQIRTDTARVVDLRTSLGRTAREAYKGDTTARALALVLRAGDRGQFEDATQLLSLVGRVQAADLRELSQVTAANQRRQDRLTAVQEEITRLKVDLERRTFDAEAARRDAERRRSDLEALVGAQQSRVEVIERRREDHLRQRAQYETQRSALQVQIDAVVAADRAEAARAQAARDQAAREDRAPASPAAPVSPSTGPSAPGTPPATGRTGLLGSPSPMNNPVITSPYGWRIHPVYGYRKLHTGTDFRAYCGTPIIAAESGTVQWAKSVGGFGNQVMLNHGVLAGSLVLTSYNHLSRFAVATGESVRRGEIIGYSGTTGTSTACHLHFEAYVDGRTVDPQTLL
ncbi:M23 family metallopeptidase [Cellulomonas carbonis]|uniref:M23 family metallopeptidase n=1 Tax=Cellulomonas carbonis TaxID=1386092 RepID=UPI000AEF89A4|nr:M23 family metallopeptidase [Cellulomonas carbonis]GGC18423.1 metalloendopeptidase [Cellulomonas carbonis]